MDFLLGHLSSDANRNLIFPDKPNNMGLYLGNISKVQPTKGLVTLELNEPLAIGDTICFEHEHRHYTVSEMTFQNTHMPEASPKTRVTMGRMKGNISVGDTVYKMASKALSTQAKNSYTLSEEKKFPLVCKISIRNGEPVRMHVAPACEHTLYGSLELEMCSAIYPEKALKTPLTRERVIAQISKTASTPYYFKQIEVDLEEGIHLPSIAGLNELRRNLLSQYEEMFANHVIRPLSSMPITKAGKQASSKTTPKVALLLSHIKEEDFSCLQNVEYVYIPFYTFMNAKLHPQLLQLTNQFHVYIVMPTILKANFKNIILTQLETILQHYAIQGFVLSNIADIYLLKDYRNTYHFVGNYTLNIFNTHSVEEWKTLGLSRATLSPELNEQEVTTLCASTSLDTELMVYGNYPIMHMSYCLLGKSNVCYPTCDMKCKHNATFYLKDRLGFQFPVVPDNLQTVTTVYNSKIPSISTKNVGCSVIRITIHDETVEEINTIISLAKQGKRLEGKSYTNGNFSRYV